MNILERPENWLNVFAMMLVLYIAAWLFSTILVVRDKGTQNG
jgi:hypothetical protein